MRSTRAVASAALMIAVLFAPALARASIGVGVGTPPLTLTTPAAPGSSTRLQPNLYVVNTGTVGATYTFKVERVSEGTGTSVPSSWVTFSPPQLTLDPGGHAWVTVTLHLPASATTGPYFSDVVAVASATEASARSVAVGAAAATLLRFEVGDHSQSPLWTIGWPWPGPVDAAAVAGLVLLGVFVAWRRLGISVSLQRAPRTSAFPRKANERP